MAPVLFHVSAEAMNIFTLKKMQQLIECEGNCSQNETVTVGLENISHSQKHSEKVIIT